MLFPILTQLQKMSSVVKIIEPSGILDKVNVDPLRKKIINEVENGADIVLIDLKNVTFMDSSGLAGLVLALKTVRAGGSQMYICCLNNPVKTLFDITNMNRVFQIYTSRKEFDQFLFSTQ